MAKDEYETYKDKRLSAISCLQDYISPWNAVEVLCGKQLIISYADLGL